MENKDELDCGEFAEGYYDVIMETTLGDYSDGLFENTETPVTDSIDVQNDSIILEKNKSYVIPLNNSTPFEDIYEDNLVQNHIHEPNEGNFVGTDTLMEIQETNLVLNDCPTQSYSNKKEQFRDDVDIANFKINRLLVNKLKLNRNCEISKANCVTVDGNNPIAKTSVLIKQETGVDPSSLPFVDVRSRDTNSNIIPKTSLLIKQEPGVDSSPHKIVPVVCVGSTDKIAETSPFHVPGEPPCTTKASTESPNDCVTCSTCSSIFLSGSIGLEQTLENSSQWQCQDCAICILCFVRTEGDGLLMCCKCGRYYHKPCVMMEKELCNLFICKFCTPEEDGT